MIAIAGLQLFSVLLIGGLGVIVIVANMIMCWYVRAQRRSNKDIIAHHAVGSALLALAWALVLFYGWVSLG